VGCNSLAEPTKNQKRISEIFREVFPMYLAIGMSYDQFWRGDPELVISYRKADELRQKRSNEEAWLNGLYVYDALAATVYNMNRKKNQNPKSYMNQPIDFSAKASRESEEQRIKNEKLKAELWMRNFVKQYAEKRGG